MNEEILRIQKMVAEGKITPEEGAELVASVGRPAAPPPQPVAAPPPAQSNRKTVGIIALCALGLIFPATQLAPILILVLIPLAIILGIIAWRTTPGKIAAIGGLLVMITLIALLFLHTGFNSSQSISPKDELKYLEAKPLQKAPSD